MRISLKQFLIPACVLAAIVFTTDKASALADPTRAVRVRTHDLDLASPQGARMLLRRLDRAVNVVCEEQTARRFPSALRQYRACYAEVMASAIARLDAPQVQEQYRRWRRS